MKIAILSDTHDNIWKLDEAMPQLCTADVVIHCGDICAPFMIRRLGEGITETPVHVIWGNNDGDHFMISQVAQNYPNIVLHGPFAHLELEGLHVAVNHYPQIAWGLALSGEYGMVCYGHDHSAHEERVGECLLLNPGELMGLNGRSTFALVEGKEVSWVEV